MDYQQLMAVGQSLGDFGNLGLKAVTALSDIEEQAKQDQWRDFQMKRAAIDFKLEQTKLQQEQAIKSKIMDEITSGMGNYKYGGNTADSLASYVKVHDWYANNAQVREMISTDPALFQAYNNLMAMGSNSMVNGHGDIPMPDGAGYPNLENIRLHPGDVSSLKDMMLVADRIPQYVEITQADGSKKTVDQRIMLYKQYGWTPESIGYDTATGRPSIVTPDEKNPTGLSYNIDANEASIRQRAQLMATEQKIPFYNALSIVKLGDIGHDMNIGGTDVKFADAVGKMRAGDVTTQAMFIAQSANPQDTVKRMSEAGISVNSRATEMASQMRLVASGGGSASVSPVASSGMHSIPASVRTDLMPSDIAGGSLIQMNSMTGVRDANFIAKQESDQQLMKGLQARGNLKQYLGDSGAVERLLLRDATVLPGPDGKMRPVIRGDNARMVARALNGATIGEELAGYVGAAKSAEIMPDISKIMFGEKGKQGEVTAIRVSDSISALEEKLPGIKEVAENNPTLVAQIDAEKNLVSKQILVESLVRDAYHSTLKGVHDELGLGVQAIAAGAEQMQVPLKDYADMLGNGDPRAVAALRVARVNDIPASDILAQAADRASGEFAEKLSVYNTKEARDKIAQVMQTKKVSDAVRTGQAGVISPSLFNDNARFLRSLQSDEGSMADVSKRGLKAVAPQAAKNLVLEFAVAGNQLGRDATQFMRFAGSKIGVADKKVAGILLGEGATGKDVYLWMTQAFQDLAQFGPAGLGKIGAREVYGVGE